jgi:hypothetical protein
LKSFQDAYGEGEEDNQGYTWGSSEDFSFMSVSFTDERGESIVLLGFDKAWTLEDARETAASFLPTDIQLGPEEPGEDETIQAACYSTSLAKVFTEDKYRKAKLKGNPGDCHYVLAPGDADTISTIYLNVGLGDTDPVPVAGTVAFETGGLGMDLSNWNNASGEPTENPITGWLTYTHKDGEINVNTIDDRLSEIEILPADGETFSQDEARAEVDALIPKDASLIETYDLEYSPGFVEHYGSSSLAGRYPDAEEELKPSGLSLWTNGDPGDFIAIYNLDPDTQEVLWIVIAIGNNP